MLNENIAVSVFSKVARDILCRKVSLPDSFASLSLFPSSSSFISGRGLLPGRGLIHGASTGQLVSGRLSVGKWT